MILTTYVCCIILFLLGSRILRLFAGVKDVRVLMQTGFSALASQELDDAAKEKISRDTALKLAQSGSITLAKTIVILTLSSLPFFIAMFLGSFTEVQFTQFVLRWDVLILTILALWLGFKLKQRLFT